jgi:hypothetical protein
MRVCPVLLARCSPGRADLPGLPRGGPGGPVYYGQQLNPGGLVTATVCYEGTGCFLVLAEDTRGWTQSTTQAANYQNALAEVIAGAPTSPSGSPETLAPFGRVTLHRNPYQRGPAAQLATHPGGSGGLPPATLSPAPRQSPTVPASRSPSSNRQPSLAGPIKASAASRTGPC